MLDETKDNSEVFADRSVVTKVAAEKITNLLNINF
jgi:hypothetical protein